MTRSTYTADPKERAIVDWRLERFTCDLGFPRGIAAALAVRRDVDRVYVEHLVRDLGYTPEQVEELLR